jgi:hypothetical protein
MRITERNYFIFVLLEFVSHTNKFFSRKIKIVFQKNKNVKTKEGSRQKNKNKK